MEFIKKMFKKHKELINYAIFGVLTTLVNYVSYILFTRVFGVNLVVSNIIAWFLSVLFAFITNKMIVFGSKDLSKETVLKEGIYFFAARIFSLILDTGILYVMSKLMGINDLIVKIVSNVIVIIVNYALSKFLIFKKDNK